MINNYDSVVACASTATPQSQKQESKSYTATKRNWLSFVTVLVTLFCFSFVQGQTTLISPTGDGGFETGTTFADNGWTAVNSATNAWNVGTATSSGGTKSAYISNTSGSTYAYSNSTTAVSHFYRDITVPASESVISLSFKLKGDGDVYSGTYYDKLMVYTAPTTFTPATSAPASSGTALTGATLAYVQPANYGAAYNVVNVVLPSSLAGTTFRLIFTWHNDSSAGTVPSSVDEISLTSRLPILADAAPITFTATAVTQTGMTVNWVDNSTNETGFRVYRSTDNITFTQVGANILTSNSAGTGTAYNSVQTGLTFGTTYYYRIVAYLEGESAPLLGTQATLSPILPTCVITPFPADAATGVTSTPVLTWVGNGDPAPTYDVYFSTNATLVTNKTASVRLLQGSATASYTPAALTLGATYYWMVVPTSTAGGPTSCPVFSFTVVAPATFTATAGGGLWSNAATWVGGVVPPAGNDVSIPAGSIVTADQNMSYRNLDISGILQWNATAPTSTVNALTIANNLTINSGGRLLAYSTALSGSFINVAGNFVNNGYANLAYALLQFNGTGSTLSGTGTFEGDGTRGFIRALTSFSGNNIINTTQDLTLLGQIAQTSGTLNTNGKLRIDNTAMIHGANLNTQVASVAVTAMGSAYSVAPIVFGTTLTHWVANTTGTQGTRYVSGNNVYVCIGGNVGATAPTHTTGVADNLLWLGTVGTLGTPYPYNAASTAGLQYFYGDNLYLATAPNLAAANTDATAPVHTSGVVNNYLYVGSVAKVSVNYDATSQTVRSLALTNAGSGYASAPTIAFTVGVNGGPGSGVAATVCVIQSLVGSTYFISQKSGQATLTGGLTINSDQGVSALSANPQASSGVGDVFTTNGGANYTVAPQVGFSGPTALNLVTSGGSGYTAAPTITVTGGTQPAGATALVTGDFTITVNQGKVVSVYLNTTVTKTYITPPTLAFTGGGTGATLAFPANCWPAATAVIGTNRQITNFTVTNSGFGYVAAPSVAVGTTSGTPTAGTYTTAITAPTARIAAYQLQINFFIPATAAVTQLDDAYVPSSRKMHALWLSGTSSAGMTLTDNLTLISSGTSTSFGIFPPSPLVLIASGNSYGNILNLGTKNLNFTWNGYSGTTSTFGATKGFVRNGTISLMGRGGSGTFNFPFSGTVAIATGTGSLATGSDIINLKVSDTAAPTNGTNGTGLATGSRAFKVETATVLGAAGTAGTNPTITLNYNSQDALTSTQNDTFVAESNSLSGPWNIRSAAVGASGALAATGSRATATTTPGPIALTNGNHFAWSNPTATITGVTPLALCANSGTFTITGTNLTGVSAVNIGGTPVTAFTVVNATTITGFAGNGTNGVVSITRNGGTILGTETITLSPSPSAPAVTPAAPSIVLGASVNLTATGTTGTMNWYTTATGGTAIYTGNTYSVTGLCTTTTYYVAENNGSCDGARQAVTVTVQPTVITSSVATFCGSGGNAVLSVSPVDPSITYTWTALTSGATLSATTGTSVTATMAATSEFKVDAVSGACATSAFYSVGVYPLPTATVTTTANGVCPGTAATIGSGLSAGNFTAACITPTPYTIPSTATFLVNNGTASVTQASGSLDDGGWSNIPLGFSFNFFGTIYTNVNVGTNGVLQFGAYNGTALGDYTIGALPNTSDPLGAIFAAANDLNAGTAGTPNTYIRYWTEGYAPNRKFIVEYNVFQYGSSSARHNIQIVAYETLGIVDIIAKEVMSSNPKSIGVNSPDGTVGAAALNCAVTPNTPNFWSATTNTILAAAPQAWRFSPPSNYTTVWTKTDSAGTSTIASGTNIFSQSVSPLETTTYSISYTNQTTGCANPAGSAQVTMAVLDGVAPTGITTTSTATGPLCAGQQVTFNTNFAGSPDGKTMQWEVSTDGGANFTNCPNGFFTLSLASPTHAYTIIPTQAGIYRCKITACNGTPSYSSNSSVSFAYNILTTTPATRCGVGTLSLAATSDATAPTDVKWYATATSTTALGTGLTFTTPSLSATTTYFVEVSTATCNSVRVPVVATINPAPALTINIASVSLCAGGSSSAVILTAGSSDYTQFDWSPSTGFTGNESTGWIFNPTQTTTYTLTASQASGQFCSSVITLPITVNANPPLTVAASLSTICEGTSTTLTATSEALSPGPSGLPAVYCVPSSSGDSNISSVYFNTLSNVVTQVAPFYDIYPATGTNTTTVTAGQTYELDVQSNAASIASVWIDYNRDGVYDATEWTQLWTNASSGSVFITIPANASAGQTGMRIRTRQTGNTNGNTSACISMGSGSTQDYTIRIENIVDVSPTLTYAWSPSTSLSSTGGTFVTASPLTTTTYTVTATSAAGCNASQTIPVTVIAKPLSPVAVPSSQCGTQQPTASVTDPNNFSSPIINWYASNTAATPLQSSFLNTFTNNVSATTTFYVSIVNPITNCESSRTPVLVTVTIPDLISATTSSAAICLGESITLTSANTSSTPSQTYTFAWSSQNGSGIVNGTPGSTLIATPTAAGTYTITATGTAAATGSVPQCVTSDSVTVVVSPIPVVTLDVPSTILACAGSTINLGASVVDNVTGTATLGSGAVTGTSYDAIFYHFYGGNKVQYLITAAELTALGIREGDITALGIDMSSVTTQAYDGFAVSMASTVNTNMSGGINSAATFSPVFSSASYTPTTGVNTFNFSTPYNWDGSSNIMIQFCWSNNNGGGQNNYALVDPQSYVSTAYYRADNQSASAICGGTTATGTTSSRPKFIFNAVVETNLNANYAWVWSNGATNVLTAASGTVTMPAGAPTTYTVTATHLVSGCSNVPNSAQVVATVVSTTAPVGVNTIAPSSICFGDAVNLSLSYTGSTVALDFQWQSSVDNGSTWVDILTATGTSYTGSQIVPTKYRCKIVSCAGTPGYSSEATVVFTNNITATSGATRCGTGNVSIYAFSSAGSTVNWYAANTGGIPLSSGIEFITPSITSTTTYYAAAVSTSSGSSTLGAGGTTSISTAASFLPGGWGGAKTQYIIKATELAAAGLSAGPITSIGFEPTDSGQTYQGFNVSIGHTSDISAPTTTFIPNTGLSFVYAGTQANGGFTPTANTINNLVFGTGTGTSNSFNWDGTSNVVVSISWSRLPGAFTATGTNMKVDDVGFVSSAFRQRDNISPTAMANETSVSGTGSNRPKFSFNGQVLCASPRVPVTVTVTPAPALTLSSASASICTGSATAAITATGTSNYNTYVWSPATGVSGNSSTGWVFNPTATTTYTLTASQSAGSLCAFTTTFTVNVNALPTDITITPANPSACVGVVLPLTTTGGIFPSNAFVETMDVLPTNFVSSANAEFTNNTDYYVQGNGSSLFTTTSTSATATLALNQNIDLSGAASASVTFSHIAATEDGFDFGYVEYSTNGGVSWTTFAPANYAGTASTYAANSRFASDSYTDWASTFTSSSSTPGAGPATSLWKAETFNIPTAALTSSQFRIRFRYTTDSSVNYYGWLIDDVKIVKSQSNITWSPVTNLFTNAAGTTPYTAGTSASTVYVLPTTVAPLTYVATSTNGATNCTKTATITLSDAVAPVVVTRPVTLQLNAAGTATLTAAQVDNGSSDNCSIATLTVSPTSFTCANVGANTVTLTATDASGNTSSLTAVVTVQDQVGPTVVTRPLTVLLNAAGTASITAAQINNGSTDTCGISSVTVSPSTFTCSNLGPNTVTLTVTDVNGNVSTGTAIVTVTVDFSVTGDNDLDGSPDNCDPDDDNDGVLDSNDNCPIQANSNQADNDADGLGDACDNDDDNDGVLDGYDNCPFIYNPGQEDIDKDGIGDICDLVEINISEAITPNGDGVNDTWFINNIDKYPNNIVKVYNRWGNLIFNKANYQNDWNGTYVNDGSSIPDASSYYYQIDLDGNGSIDYKGWIYITK
jgi:gliding motility-associated-like protein